MLFTWYVTLSQDVFFKVHFHMKKDLQGSVLEQVTPAQRQKFCIQHLLSAQLALGRQSAANGDWQGYGSQLAGRVQAPSARFSWSTVCILVGTGWESHHGTKEKMGALDAAHKIVTEFDKKLTPHMSEGSTPAELLRGHAATEVMVCRQGLVSLPGLSRMEFSLFGV